MSDRALVRLHEPSTGRRAHVGGDVTMRQDELVIRLRPTVTDAAPHGRERQTVTTRPIPQPLVIPPAVYQQPARWVLDQQAVTALLCFALITALVVAIRLVIP